MKNQNTTAVQSVLRTEEKYLLSHPQALTLQNKLRALLHVDDFGDNDGYRVRSLYFDSFHNIDYREKMPELTTGKKFAFAFMTKSKSMQSWS